MAARSRFRIRTTLVVTLLGAFVASLAPAAATGERTNEGCIPSSPQQMIEIAMKYIDAFLHPERAVDIPAADDVRRVELPPVLPRESGGPVTARSGTELKAFHIGMPTLRFLRSYGNVRWVIDVQRCEAVALWLLDWDASALKYSLHITERFRISAGLIEEVEVILWRADGVNGTCWPPNGDPNEGRTANCAHDPTTPPFGAIPGCTPGTRDAITTAGNTYLRALNSGNASAVPLAEKARRTEKPPPPGAGPVTGTSGKEIVTSLENDARYRSIVDVRNVRWFVDARRCQAIAFYLTDTVNEAGEPTGTVHHATRFLVSDGLIHEIEEVHRGPIDPTIYEGSCWPQAWSDAEDERYRLVACPATD